MKRRVNTPAGQIWTWYYYAGSQRIAMRVQGSTNPSENGVFYLFGDHLGSTTATLNAAGQVVGQMRYKPWGQTRYANGNTPTDYQYTGQKNTDLGIYFYNARWFDPALGRFLSADTLIPQPGNPLDWDRYSYTRNNPITYNDPSGHDVDCGLSERCKLSTVNEFKRVIKQTYKINVSKSASFDLKEMRTIYNAIGTMEAGINSLTNGSGLSWITGKFGDATITERISQGGSYVVGSTIHLGADFANKTWSSLDGTAGTMILHEFGHVLDNRSKTGIGDASIFGGGAGDQLMKFINAKPRFAIRAAGGINYGDSPFTGYDVRYPREGTVSYGNNSTADYFANTFSAAITGYQDDPQIAVMWMAAYIDLSK